MCKAYILRFSCSHGVLMGLDSCNMGPCPVLKLSGSRLPQQPYRCYNCQYKLERTSVSSSTGSSRTSSQESLNSSMSGSSLPPIAELPRKTSLPCHPLPGVAIQPTGCTRMRNKSSPARPFSFSCNGSSHFATPHYSGLPGHLPHQDHSCPPCQLEELRQKADTEVVRTAKALYPNLRAEMLVRDGRLQEWKGKPTLEKYVEEKRCEERELWVHVTRKWTQDLKKSRVLVAEEDGLGLLG